MELSSNGGPASTTSLFIRGGESRFTALFIDGIRIDSQATGGASWETIPISEIEKIEILRGPSASIYGSDAVSGVIKIFTRKGKGEIKKYFGFGIGSHNTNLINSGFSGSISKLDFALGASREISSGYNLRESLNVNNDKDGYSRNSYSAKFGYKLNSNHKIETSFLNSYLKSQYDQSVNYDDRNNYEINALGINFLSKWTNKFSTKVSVKEGENQYEIYPNIYQTKTKIKSYLWQNNFRFDSNLLNLTFERREDYLDNTGVIPNITQRNQNAVALGLSIIKKTNIFQINFRQDNDSEFGLKNSGTISYGYKLNPNLRLSFSTSTGFRAPTLYQRFSVYGISSLEAENNQNTEINLDYKDAQKKYSLIIYRNNVNNLITFSSPGSCASSFGCYANTDRARFEGITVISQQKFDTFFLNLSLNFQNPVDLDTNKLLARRSRFFSNINFETKFNNWNIGSEYKISGKRFDESLNINKLESYSVINLYGSRQFSKNWNLVFRVNNLLNDDYQLAKNYFLPGRVFFIFFNWEPK